MIKIKICGLSSKEAVEQAVESGADYIGFILAKSKRQVGIKQASHLAQLISETVQKVGVFVSPTLLELQEAITKVPLDLVQIHGEFADENFEKMKFQVFVPFLSKKHWEKFILKQIFYYLTPP